MIHKLAGNVYRRFRKISLKRKLAMIIAALFIPYTIITLFLLYNMNSFYEEYNTIGENVALANKYNIEFKEDMDAVMYQMVIRSMNKEEIETELNMENPDDMIRKAKNSFTALRKSSFSSEAKESAKSILNLLDTLQERVNDINDRVKVSGYYDQNVLSLDTDIRIITELIQERISEYNYYEAAGMEDVQKELGQRLDLLIQISLVVFVTMVVASLSLATFLSRSITSSVENLEDTVEQFGQGNFAIRTKGAGDTDLEVLYEAFNSMADQIEVLVEHIKEEQINSRNLELKLLQAQINPHFLYNTLDNIVWLVEDDRKEDAENIVTYLSKFFRTTLSGGRDFITVKEEFEHIEAYLKIQSFRYRDILSFELELPEVLENYLIIKMALQPIVENALYHGIKYKRSMGKIVVRAEDAGESIRIRVLDDGIGMIREDLLKLRHTVSDQGNPTESDNGFGMYNVAERLRMNYGMAYGLTVESEYGKGTEVVLLFPKRTKS
ncbi:MAG: sensor histidine kinase [Lachnospiraceae bacterium]|nr:sensor histidine kinase [Lachnospiraceae bacterium]